MNTLTLTRRPEHFAVCRLEPHAPLPIWATSGALYSVTRTPAELSIVCPQQHVPDGVHSERGWVCFAVAGPLDFGLTGILAGLTAPLAAADISVFALSTFDTDYLLVKAEQAEKAAAALSTAGFRIDATDDAAP